MTRQGGLHSLPSNSAMQKFQCVVNLPGPGYRKLLVWTANCLWRRLCIVIGDNKKSQHWKVAAKAASESRRASTAKTRRLPANDFSFLLWLLFTLSHSVILRKCTTMAGHTNVFFHPTWVGDSTWVPTSMYLNRPRPKIAVWATGASTLRAASKTWSHGTNLPLILLQVIQDGNTILNTTCEATL